MSLSVHTIYIPQLTIHPLFSLLVSLKPLTPTRVQSDVLQADRLTTLLLYFTSWEIQPMGQRVGMGMGTQYGMRTRMTRKGKCECECECQRECVHALIVDHT